MIELYGHGYIGSAIAAELKKQNVPFRHLRHTELPSPKSLVINAAGHTGFPNVDGCETSKIETILANVVFPVRLSQNNKVIHISSGCIYSGDKHGTGWREEDEPNFDGSFYSLTKQAMEKALTGFDGYILRLRMPFSADRHRKNLLTKLEQYECLVDSVNSLSRVEDIARTSVWFSQHLPDTGTYNVCNPGAISTKEIADMMGLHKEWMTLDEFEKKTVAKRSFCVLDTHKLQDVYKLPHVHDALEETLKARRANGGRH